MGKKNKNKSGSTGGAAAAPEAAEPAKAERPRCPTCGRVLPKAKPVDKAAVTAKLAKVDGFLASLEAKKAAWLEKQEKYKEQLEVDGEEAE